MRLANYSIVDHGSRWVVLHDGGIERGTRKAGAPLLLA